MYQITKDIEGSTQWSHTPIPFQVGSTDWDTYSDYYWIIGIYKETEYQSGTYEKITERRIRPDADGAYTMDLSAILKGFVSAWTPDVGQDVVVRRQVGMLRYQVTVQEVLDGVGGTVTTRAGLVIRGAGQAHRLFKSGFLDLQLLNLGRLLTDQPREKRVFETQREWLSFIVPLGTTTTIPGITAEVTWEDDTSDTYTISSAHSAVPGDVVLYSSGFHILQYGVNSSNQISALSKPVKSWTVYVKNQDGTEISERMTYVLETCEFSPYLRYLLWENRMGGWDTIAMRGEVDVEMQTSKRSAQAINSPLDYGEAREELYYDIRSRDVMTMHSGWMDQERLNWAKSMVNSSTVYILADDYFPQDNPNGEVIPVSIDGASYPIHRDREFLRSIRCEARKAIATRYL